MQETIIFCQVFPFDDTRGAGINAVILEDKFFILA
jgi:hypothetical protein